MQYWRPGGALFVGDCMPFSREGVFHLYYLQDENHHQGLGGLGGHQWAHASSTDLVHWTHHPLALCVEEPWEGSICTGSVFWHAGVYHAFYATRKPDWTQHLCHATSQDGILFVKDRPIPLVPQPPQLDTHHFRDPFVFQAETGRFQLLITTRRAAYPVRGAGGCLWRFSSEDLQHWTDEGCFIMPGGGESFGCIPECPDCFEWNGRWYLIYGDGLRTRYRMAHHWNGPWERPAIDLLDSPLNAVMKTAPWHHGRRIGVGWLASREGDRDDGRLQWGGETLFREIRQHPDGTLSAEWLPELTPQGTRRLVLPPQPLTGDVELSGGCWTLDAARGPAAAWIPDLPLNYHLRCRLRDGSPSQNWFLGLRAQAPGGPYHSLRFDAGSGTLSLEAEHVAGLPHQLERLDVICHGSVIDVQLNTSRCLVNRLPELSGEGLLITCQSGRLSLSDLEILPI